MAQIYFSCKILYLPTLLVVFGFSQESKLESLDIEVVPAAVDPLEHTPFTWDCSSSGAGKVLWQKEGKWIDEGGQILTNGSLFLDDVSKRKHAGIYRCCLSNDQGILCSKKAFLTVAALEPVTIEPPVVLATDGGIARIKCNYGGAPKPHISWIFDKHTLSIQNNSRLTILPQGILQISHVRASDEGLYRCRAENIVGQVKSGISLLELDKSERTDLSWVSKPQDTVVNVGETAVLECIVNSVNSSMLWTKSGSNQTYPNERNLWLKDVNEDDAGVYQCLVFDHILNTTISSSALLEVHAKPILICGNPVIEATSGSLERLHAVSSTTVEWIFNGQPLSFASGSVGQSNSGLVIRQVSILNAGIYQAYASNAAGETLCSFRVTVNQEGLAGPPQNLTVVAVKSRSFVIKWNQPVINSIEFPIITYVINYSPVNGSSPDILALHSDLTNLTHEVQMYVRPFTTYSVYIVTFNGKGGSNRSESVQFTTLEDVPDGAPSIYMSITSTGGLNISWDPLPPESVNGHLTGFMIQYIKEGKELSQRQQIYITPPAYTYLLEDLKDIEMYVVRVAATTAVGVGKFSQWTSVVKKNCGKNVSLSVTHMNSSSVTLEWTSCKYGIVSYRIYLINLQNSRTTSKEYPASVSKTVFTGLASNTTYKVFLEVVGKRWDSSNSTAAVTTFFVPSGKMKLSCPITPPVAAVTDITSRSITLGWTPMPFSDVSSGLRIRYWPNDDTKQIKFVSVNKSETEWKFHGLKPFSCYSFEIQVKCAQSYSESSKTYSEYTSEDVPAGPPFLSAEALDQHTVELQWSPPAEPNGKITHYIIMYNTDLQSSDWTRDEKRDNTLRSTVSELYSGTKYFFKIRAGTKVGEGPESVAVPAVTLEETSRVSAEQIYIVLGVGLAVLCIMTSGVLIFFKCRDVRQQQQPAEVNSSVGEGPVDETPHDETTLPMLHANTNGYTHATSAI